MVQDRDRETWAAVESDYLSGCMSVQEIARKHGVSASTIYKKATSLGWKKKQAKIRQKADEIVLARHARARAKEMEIMCSASAGLARLLDKTIGALEGMEPEEVIKDLRGVGDLAKAIKTNTDALMLLHGIQTPAQLEAQRIARARLKMDERKARREEMASAEDQQVPEVVLTIVERTKTEAEDGGESQADKP